MVSEETDSPGDPDEPEDPADSEDAADSEEPEESGELDESEESEESEEPDESEEPEADQDEAAWDEGVEDLPEVEAAWDSVEESPEHRGGEELGDRIEHDVSRGAVRRALGAASAVLLVVLALALVVAMLRSDSDSDGDGDSASVDADTEVSIAPPPSIPDDAGDVVVDPVADPDYTATLDEIIALEEGDEPESERIVLEVDDGDLPAPAGSVTATLIFFDGTPQVLMAGPARWLTSACIQTTVATDSLEAVDAGYHDTPTGECGAAGIGRQSQVACIGDDVIMLDIDLVDEGATSGSARLVADSVRVALVDFPDDFEQLSLLGTIRLPSDFKVSDLPLARAPRGSELTIELPGSDGEVDATCQTR